MNKRNQITEGVIWKQLLLFFFPIVFGTFFQQIYNTADTIVVGRFVGKDCLLYTSVSFQMGEFPVLKKEPVDLVITNTGNKVLELTGNTCVTVGIPCDRCLEQVKVEIPCHIERKLDMKLTDCLLYTSLWTWKRRE